MKAIHRRAALACAALATAAATVWVSRDDTAEHAVVPSASAHVAPAAAAPAPMVAAPQAAPRARRAAFPDAPADPFVARSWAPPTVEQAAAPTAPPLPFTYFGRIAEAGTVQVFLQRGERTYSVAAGDVIDGRYRIEAITPAAVVITYLPLAQRQVLHTGSQ